MFINQIEFSQCCASTRSTRKCIFKHQSNKLVKKIYFPETSRLKKSICKVTGTIECNKYCKEERAYKGYCHEGICQCIY